MQSSALWSLLNALPRPALREIGKMTRSPYFNRRADVIALFAALERCAKRGVLPEREVLFRQVYAGKPFDMGAFRLTMHFLTEIIRQYLVMHQLRDKSQFSMLLAKACHALDLPEQARRALRLAGDNLEAAPARDPEWHERRFRVQAEEFRHPAGAVRTQRLNLQDLSDSLERSFVLRKLKIACEQLSHQTVFPAEYDFGLLKPVLNGLKNRPDWLSIPEIGLYYHCCLALLYPGEEEHFQAMKPLLLRQPPVFSAEENRDVFLLAINFCIRKVNEGQIKYAEEGLVLYKHALEYGYLLEKGELSRFSFRNIVGMGLKIKAFDWVEWFIHEYQERIVQPHRESMVNFNLARLEYGRRHYAQAIELLQKADYDDLLLHLAAKTLLLKIYYEAGEWRLLESLLEAFQIFLRRKKIIGYHRSNYQRVVRLFQKLLTINRFDPGQVAAFRASILADGQLAERDWFLERVSEWRG